MPQFQSSTLLRNPDGLTLSDGVEGEFSMDRAGNVRLVSGYSNATTREWSASDSASVLRNLYSWPTENKAKMDAFFGKEKMAQILSQAGARPTSSKAPSGKGQKEEWVAKPPPVITTTTTPFYKQWWFWPSVILGTTTLVGGGLILWRTKHRSSFDKATERSLAAGRRGMELGATAASAAKRKGLELKQRGESAWAARSRKPAAITRRPVRETLAEEIVEGTNGGYSPEELESYTAEELEELRDSLEADLGRTGNLGNRVLANRNPREPQVVIIKIIGPDGEDWS